MPGLQPAARELHSLAAVEHYLICAGGMQLLPHGEAHALTDTMVRPPSCSCLKAGPPSPSP